MALKQITPLTPRMIQYTNQDAPLPLHVKRKYEISIIILRQKIGRKNKKTFISQ